jgi:hypothetical protein
MKLTSWLSRNRVKPARRTPHLRVQRLEDRVQPAVYYSFDGYGNNTAHPTWGQAGSDLIRLSPVGYTDGISSPSLPTDQSARAISNILNNQLAPNSTTQDIDTVDQLRLTDFNYVFGQFVDHDMDLTPDGGSELDIPVAANDPIGPNALPFTRSQYDSATGTSVTNPRQQVTDITAYLDLSQVYGSDAATADALRTHVGGQMKTSPGNMLPYFNSAYFTTSQLAAINASVGGMANDGPLPSTSLFVTGDTRGNENNELTALQTLFLRNHNRIAAQLQASHPTWTDEQLYQEARALNIAGYQQIVYQEWIPPAFGPQALRPYAGYNPNLNASIANEFSTAGFRFGHSLLDNTIERQTNNGTDVTIAGGASVPLAFDFFNPTLLNPAGVSDAYTGLTSTGIDPILKADADGPSQAMDTMAVESVRNLLFGGDGDGGEDLIARDVQRGRDNGLPDYNTMQVAYGLPPVTSFAQITQNVTVQQDLAKAYPDVNHIDAFEGGLAEDHVPGSDVGPLFQRIITDQFMRLRDGDRLFYLNQQWTPEELNIIGQNNALGKVIAANTTINNLQPNVFVFQSSIGGTVFNDLNSNRQRDPGEAGMPNVTVQLRDAADNSLIATTVTDTAGNYQFNALNGLTTGQFLVREVAPTGFAQTTVPSAMQAISRGNVNPAGVNFGNGVALTGVTVGPFAPIDQIPSSPLSSPPPAAAPSSQPAPAAAPAPAATPVPGSPPSTSGDVGSITLTAAMAADATSAPPGGDWMAVDMV